MSEGSMQITEVRRRCSRIFERKGMPWQCRMPPEQPARPPGCGLRAQRQTASQASTCCLRCNVARRPCRKPYRLSRCRVAPSATAAHQ